MQQEKEQIKKKIKLIVDSIDDDDHVFESVDEITSCIKSLLTYKLDSTILKTVDHIRAMVYLIDSNLHLFPLTDQLKNMLLEMAYGLKDLDYLPSIAIYNPKVLDFCIDLGIDCNKLFFYSDVQTIIKKGVIPNCMFTYKNIVLSRYIKLYLITK